MPARISSGPATIDDLVMPSIARIATPEPDSPRIQSHWTSGSQCKLLSNQAAPRTISMIGSAASRIVSSRTGVRGTGPVPGSALFLFLLFLLLLLLFVT